MSPRKTRGTRPAARISATRLETNAIRRGWASAKGSMLAITLMLTGLGVFLGLTWWLVEALGALGHALFLPPDLTHPADLRNNRLLNRLELTIPAGLSLFMVIALVMDWWGGKRRRASLPRLGKRLAACTALGLLLCTPGLRTHAVVADGWLHRQAFWSAQPERWALRDLTCVRQTVSGRGLVAWDFHFRGEYAFSESGMNAEAFAEVLRQSGRQPTREPCTTLAHHAPGG